jgi:hypothetical protein
MADTRDVEGDLSLAVQHPGALIEPTRQEHRPVHLK